ncbi:MAG: indolepyruvate ferredoxin oxidoreductase [Planctomycetes bacterium]|nr:indolepyruvate ferredoxin oxidoreductase [Planctomycetota bacterium]
MLGDDAVAFAALHAGIHNAYAYPGTPSTEIFARVIRETKDGGEVVAHWCANEKSAYEGAIGASLAGRRALVTMKHVGLNVAMDPFVNSALLGLGGGLVVAVADDPGMHSSQNEQDSRCLAEFARVPCLEPATPQEAYDMTREAFALSERCQVPVVLRLVTRLCHERARVRVRPAEPPKPLHKAGPRQDWVLLPANARRLFDGLLAEQPELRAASERSPYNRRTGGAGRRGVLTTGIGRRYLGEVLPEMREPPPHLHIATYPLPEALVRAFAADLDEVLVLEDGYPFVERSLRGLLPEACRVLGRESGALPASGELNVVNVRAALGLPALPLHEAAGLQLPARPPRLCDGCVHRDSYAAMLQVMQDTGIGAVTGDIGCYTLGALPPYQAIDSCVCMGASIGMAKGASDAGLRPAIAVIGDSTFLHSGIPPLVDAIAHDTDMTVLILDNETTAMTGGQPTELPDSRLLPVVLGLGADPAHVHVFQAHPRKVPELAALIRKEVAHPGLSLIVVRRECVQTASARRKHEG